MPEALERSSLWQLAHQLAADVHRASEQAAGSDHAALVTHLRAAALAVTAHLATAQRSTRWEDFQATLVAGECSASVLASDVALARELGVFSWQAIDQLLEATDTLQQRLLRARALGSAEAGSPAVSGGRR